MMKGSIWGWENFQPDLTSLSIASQYLAELISELQEHGLIFPRKHLSLLHLSVWLPIPLVFHSECLTLGHSNLYLLFKVELKSQKVNKQAQMTSIFLDVLASMSWARKVWEYLQFLSSSATRKRAWIYDMARLLSFILIRNLHCIFVAGLMSSLHKILFLGFSLKLMTPKSSLIIMSLPNKELSSESF